MPILRFVCHRLLGVALLSLCLFPPSGARADTVTLKDGQTLTGSVTEDRSNFIMFNDPAKGTVRLEKSNISRIDKSAGPTKGNNAAQALTDASSQRQRGNYGDAIQTMLKAANSPEAIATLSPEFRTVVNELYQQGMKQAEATPDQARLSFRTLYDAMRNPSTQALLGGRQAYQQTVEAVSKGLGNADAALAQRLSSNSTMKTQMISLLNEAVIATKGQNLDYRLALGDAARDSAQWKLAYDNYSAIASSPQASADMKQTVSERLERIETLSGGQFKAPVATASAPNPTPAPTATPYSGWNAPQPQTAQAPAATPVSPQPGYKAWLAKLKLGALWNNIRSGTGKFDFASLIPWAIGIILFILLFWIIPKQVLKFLAKRGDTLAAEYIFPSRRYGLVSLLLYFFKKMKQPRSKNRCPFCGKGIDNIQEYGDLNFVVCPHCREPITPIYEMKDYVDHLIAQLRISQKQGGKRGKNDTLIEKDAMLKLVRGVLALAIRRRASDIHMETETEGGKIRARIDGIMYELLVLPREIASAFISAIKVMANLDITERRVPQDGKISLWLDQQDFDLRVNTSPAAMGEKAVIRILNQNSINVDPTRLGMEGENLARYMRNISKPHGVIIVTGPSGSGKSTTLYVALNQLNNGEKNIVTIEDPIEYKLKGLSQMQVNPVANFTFANGLRSILRQDPDVIMVGEIRDKETAEAALEAAMTGHLVLTTLHTIDAPTAFSRMRDLGIEQLRLASAVNLVIAQRLVRTICPDCKQLYKPKSSDLEMLGLSEDEGIQFVHGTGCSSCVNTGYYGRMAIYEMLELNDEIRSLLENNAQAMAIREAGRQSGMRTLREEGIHKIREGLTTVEEVIRVTTV